MSDLRPDALAPDLVRLASDLLDAEAAEPVFISVDGRTVSASLVRRAVRRLLDARLAAAATTLATTSSGADAGLEPVRVALTDVAEHVLAWDSVVLSEALAADLVLTLAGEGWVDLVRREERAVWLLPTGAGGPPRQDAG